MAPSRCHSRKPGAKEINFLSTWHFFDKIRWFPAKKFREKKKSDDETSKTSKHRKHRSSKASKHRKRRSSKTSKTSKTLIVECKTKTSNVNFFLIGPISATFWIYLSLCDKFTNYGNYDNDRKLDRQKKKYLLFYLSTRRGFEPTTSGSWVMHFLAAL